MEGSFFLLWEILKIFWWCILILLLWVLLKSPQFKGYIGELRLRLAARAGLDKEHYHPIHNVTLPTPDGGTTQIDHIFLSRFGVFVVETKNMSGWIFGGARQATWTQKIYRQSFKFQNPLRQNYKHVKTLEALLNIPPQSMHSLVVFVGSSTFKTPMPSNVTDIRGCLRYIKSKQAIVFSDEEIEGLITKIESGRLARTIKTHHDHVRHVKRKMQKSGEPTCPTCGRSMGLRTAKGGPHDGSRFWVCSAHPTCKGVKKHTESVINP